MASSIIFTDSREPGHWCGAALRLCEPHLVVGEEEDTRYPEQWIYLLWRPTARAVPFSRPDGWGLTVGHPQHEMRECLPTAFDPQETFIRSPQSGLSCAETHDCPVE